MTSGNPKLLAVMTEIGASMDARAAALADSPWRRPGTPDTRTVAEVIARIAEIMAALNVRNAAL